MFKSSKGDYSTLHILVLFACLIPVAVIITVLAFINLKHDYKSDGSRTRYVGRISTIEQGKLTITNKNGKIRIIKTTPNTNIILKGNNTPLRPGDLVLIAGSKSDNTDAITARAIRILSSEPKE